MTAFVAARVVRQIVASTKAPVAAIINSEDVVASAKAIPTMLPAQNRPVKRIIFVDGLNFFRKLNNKTHGIT